MARALMIQGTGSDVGKSLIVAGLCRLFARRGLAVRPFKPQNMSNNAAVTADGGEIGRAQALQARAAGVPLSVHMNPILLKPEAETGAQVIVQGRRRESLSARAYLAQRESLLPVVLDSFRRLAAGADLVLVEGAGSPAEVNLRAGDIANMGFAEAAGVPVVLVADIHRGGVIASLVGTAAVIAPAEKARIRGYLINKMRGDPTLFADGVRIIGEHTGWPCFGIVPHYDGAAGLPAEDAMEIRTRAPSSGQAAVKVAVPQLSRIANFDDLDPLSLEPSVSVDFVAPGRPLPVDADLVLLPGSKSTLADLAFLRAQGWHVDLAAHVRRGGHVLGLCGGYQMLGTVLRDPDGVDGAPGEVPGLGLLDVETVMAGDKTLLEVTGCHVPSGCALRGYEMHMGRTIGPDCARPLVLLEAPEGEMRLDGARSADGRVAGCYVHGFFASDPLRRAILESLGAAPAADLDYDASVTRALDGLADLLQQTVDVEALLAAAGPIA
ncbi:MAG: cobyric acid synthase [Alphaproteobacteria bacterium]|jgi:adenosylcobyric acid synthase|nr:cobyric acid synthase [Alphaproteobacteria bacterium]